MPVMQEVIEPHNLGDEMHQQHNNGGMSNRGKHQRMNSGRGGG